MEKFLMNKEDVFKNRNDFFTNIFENICNAPTKTDILVGQAKYYVTPDRSSSFIDAQTGDLAIVAKGEFFKKKFTIYYSLWQIGDLLKIGIKLFEEDLIPCFVTNSETNEIASIWGKEHTPKINLSPESYIYDWEFSVPDLYKSYLNQEKFIFGCRHMHIRVMKTLSEYCENLQLEDKIAELDAQETLESLSIKKLDTKFIVQPPSSSLDDLNPFDDEEKNETS